MTYCRHPYDTADDMLDAFERDARAHPDPWIEIDGASPTPEQLAADRAEIATLEEGLAEIEDEIAQMALRRDPELARWQRLAEDARRDLAQARAVLAKWSDR